MNILLSVALVIGAVVPAAEMGSQPMSRSSSRVDVDEGSLRWTLRVQAQSVYEVLPALDVNGDGGLDLSELEGGRAGVSDYLAGSYQLSLNEDGTAPLLGELTYLGAPRVDGLGGDFEWFEIAWERPLQDVPAGVAVTMELFEVTSPDHLDMFELRREGRLCYTALFSAEKPGAWILLSEDDVMSLWDWIVMGFSHIVTGLDHLAFLAALIVCVRGPKQVALVITAFTLSHSLTLALSALDIFRLPSRFVELVIALSVAYVALGGFAKEPRRGLWLESMLFGLVHGLGFASFLGEALVMEERRLGALFGFNIGVELGQLLFVLPLAFVLVVLRRRSGSDSEFLVPFRARRLVASGVALAGIYWFVERAGWIA